MPGWASGPCWSTGGPSYERATLAALCYPERAHSRDKTGQLCTNTHSSGLLHEAKSAPPPRKRHFQASLTGNVPPGKQLPALLKYRQAGHLCLRPLAVTSGYIKKSPPLSCSGWPCCTKVVPWGRGGSADWVSSTLQLLLGILLQPGKKMEGIMEPTHTRSLLNTQISSHEQLVRQLPAVGSCVLTGQRPRQYVCPVVNCCCVLYKDKIILAIITSDKFKRTETNAVLLFLPVWGWQKQVVSCLYGK